MDNKDIFDSSTAGYLGQLYLDVSTTTNGINEVINPDVITTCNNNIDCFNNHSLNVGNNDAYAIVTDDYQESLNILNDELDKFCKNINDKLVEINKAIKQDEDARALALRAYQNVMTYDGWKYNKVEQYEDKKTGKSITRTTYDSDAHINAAIDTRNKVWEANRSGVWN